MIYFNTQMLKCYNCYIIDGVNLGLALGLSLIMVLENSQLFKSHPRRKERLALLL